METPRRKPAKPGTEFDADTGQDTHPDEDQLEAPTTPTPAHEELGKTRVLSAEEQTQLAGENRHTEEALKKRSSLAAGGQEISKVGEFQLRRKLGEGAMGAVYQAFQEGFNRVVALKVLFSHIAKNRKLVERLHREGRVMGQLDHANIVQGYGVYEDEKLGWHYVAMEFVDGDSLQKWLTQLGALSVGDALNVTLACARALEYAHGMGLVHRDIKPDNVLIARGGAVKVTDLGMVKTSDEDMALTQTGHAVGTPWYMPLEQAKNAKDTDARCDIYALGCMLYCMLTGAPPFAGQTIVQVIQAKEVGTFPTARSRNPEVPEKLDLIIVKMTAKHPKYRYQSCTELIQDLEALGLAHDLLSFVKAKASSTAKMKVVEPPMNATVATPIGETRGPDDWYLKMTSPQGRSVSKKITTAEIQRMLADGLLKATSQISRDPKEGYRNLATFKEFQGTILEKASKKATKPQSARYKSLYKEIEDTAIEREEADNKVVTSADYWIPFLFKVGAAMFGAVLLVYFIKYLITGLGE